MANTIGRTFGIEFECVGLSQYGAQRALDTAGIGSREANYSGHDYTIWQVKEDGSLPGTSCEVVSPVLSWGNPDHVRTIETVTTTLRRAGATVDRSCGTHVHVGAQDLSKDDILATAVTYRALQESIDANLSASRVNTRWARRVPTGYSFDSWADRFNTNRLQYEDRYTAVNLNKYGEFGTIEFRQRNGTLNARKALEWAGLCLSLVKYGDEYGTREGLGEDPDHAGCDSEGVWSFLTSRSCLDAHASLWHTGRRPVVVPEAGSFARLLGLQGLA